MAYMINVPHAFTPEYPADETCSQPCKVPVILNVHDGYMAGANGFDLAVDVEAVFDHLVDLTWCHQSQFCEWLPWVNTKLGTTFSLNLGQLKSLVQDNAGAVGDLSAQLAGSLKLGGQMLLGVVVNVMLLPKEPL